MITATPVAEGTALRCTVSPSALAAGLSLVSRAISPSATLPILSSVLV